MELGAHEDPDRWGRDYTSKQYTSQQYINSVLIRSVGTLLHLESSIDQE
jgi:hypothetical protein